MATGAAAGRWRLLLGVLLLATALCLPARAVRAQVAVEADLKAALVYNFALFTEWAPDAPGSSGSRFTICYVGTEVAAAFAQLADKQIRARTVVARSVAADGPFEGCQIVYWHDGIAKRASPGKPGPGVLTIGSGAGFLARGGMIELRVENARIVFSINPDSARAAGLLFSSKLLRLAANVSGKAL
jgi:hypothetical protein